MATLNHAAVHPPPYSNTSSSVLASDSSVTSLTPASGKEYVELPAREVFPELDPHFEPTYRKFRTTSICISVVLIVRVLILGFLSFPWALKSLLSLPNGPDPGFVLYQVVNIELFIIPEELRDETMIRYLLAFVFPVDLGVCVCTCIVGLFIRNIAWSSFLCILWLCFILITFVIYLLGVVMFFLCKQYLTIFYVDMVLLPILTALVIRAIKCLRVWGTKGYKRFVQPYKVVTDEPKKQDPQPASKVQTHTAHPVVTPHHQPHPHHPQPHPHHHHPSISFHPNTPIPNPHRDNNHNDHHGPRKSVTPPGNLGKDTNLVSRQPSVISKPDAMSSTNVSKQASSILKPDAESGTSMVSKQEVNTFKQDAAKLFGHDTMLAERRKSRILEEDINRLERRKSRMLEDEARLERRKSRARDDSNDYHHEKRKSRVIDDSDDYRYDKRKSRTRDDSESGRDKRRKSRARSEDHHNKDRRKSKAERSGKSKHHHRK